VSGSFPMFLREIADPTEQGSDVMKGAARIRRRIWL
jgi:hypothetical protein